MTTTTNTNSTTGSGCGFLILVFIIGIVLINIFGKGDYDDGFRDGVIHQQEIELKAAQKRVRKNRIDSIQRVTPKSRIRYDEREDYDI